MAAIARGIRFKFSGSMLPPRCSLRVRLRLSLPPRPALGRWERRPTPPGPRQPESHGHGMDGSSVPSSWPRRLSTLITASFTPFSPGPGRAFTAFEAPMARAAALLSFPLSGLARARPLPGPLPGPLPFGPGFKLPQVARSLQVPTRDDERFHDGVMCATQRQAEVPRSGSGLPAGGPQRPENHDNAPGGSWICLARREPCDEAQLRLKSPNQPPWP